MSRKLWRMMSVLRRYQREIERDRSPEDMIKEFNAASELSTEPTSASEPAAEWTLLERRRRMH
jgi:hypothetical protein